MQARAVLEAAADRIAAGGDPRPEIMIPLVATAPELALVRAQVEAVAEAVRADRGIDLPVRIGTMIEVPRAALTADQIAAVRGLLLLRHQRPDPADLGLLARRRRGGVLPDLPRPGILSVSPFESIDEDGVGALVLSAARLGRETRPDLHLGVCGEHGGDPQSIHFFEHAGLDYVSCSPFRVPVARLEAARSRLG